MKKFRWIGWMFLAGIVCLAQNSFAQEELPNEYHESWPVSEVNTLEVDTKYGEVKVRNDGGNEVTIDVEISVEAANEKRVREILDQIEIIFSKSRGTIKAKTVINGNLKGQNKLDIDYDINIPSDKNLNISNRYGNTIIAKLEANGEFDTKYGNFTANTLNTPADGSLQLSLAYGNATIGAASNLKLEVSYSPVTIGELNTMYVESKYSTVNVEEASEIIIESKYDKFNFEEVDVVSASTKYTHIKIEELGKSLKVDAGYGGIKVSEIADDFDFIDVSNSYGHISLGLDDASYQIYAECHYCGISYPEDRFSGDRIKENNSRTIKGNVGTTTGGSVSIKSRYGDIKLRD
jgi:hypothetical protein